jgi:hypothetical protein
MYGAPRNSFEWLNVEASPGGVEADDLVDQVEAERKFGREVRCSSGSMTTPCARNIAFAARPNRQLDRYCLEVQLGSRPPGHLIDPV